MTIKDVIKNTLLILQKEGTTATPDEYKRVFCIEAKKANIAIPDCNELERYIQKLDERLKKQLQGYPIKSLDDLISFLSAAANRDKGSDYVGYINSLLQLLKKILASIGHLHNKEAAQLAQETLNKLDMLNDASNVDKMRDKWSEFHSRYKDDFLDEWSAFLKVTRNDFKTFNQELLEFFKKSTIKDALPNIIEAITLTFEPSINSAAKSELLKEAEELKNNQTLILDKSIVKKIKKIVQKRVELDRLSMEEKTNEIAKIIDLITQKLGKVSNKNSQIQAEIVKIKEKIKRLGSAQISIDELKDQLNEITNALDNEIESLNYEIYSKQKEIDRLKERILNLESELESAKNEAMTDTLTKVGTKKLLLEELDRFENLYKRHQTGYSIVFFDIDYFKKINDTYGHDAGDKVLSSFGAIIKKHARKEDIIARYGGEEFVAILPETDLKGAVRFAENIREIVEHSKFLYKNDLIVVTISAGACERSSVNSKEEAMQKADEELYRAKKNGRNRVYPKIDD